jgi:hypothetical protein
MSTGGGHAFCITADDVREPRVARKFVRHESLGFRRLEDAFNGGRASRVSGQRENLAFPDDSVLLMIGHTDELLEACRRARDDIIHYIQTSSKLNLAIRYVRMDVGGWETDTLIAIAADRGLLPAPSNDGWHGYTLTSDAVSTWDREHNYDLPAIIRAIKQHDGDAWIKKG